MDIQSKWNSDPKSVLEFLVQESRWLSERAHADRPQDKRAWASVVRHLQAAKQATKLLYRPS